MESPANAARGRRSPTSRGRPYTVVLVDDHDLVRGALRQTLSAAGMRVVGEGRTPQAGLEAVRALEPAVVVTDVVFGGVPQPHAVQEISRLAPGSRVVVLTSSRRHELLLGAITAGARGYLLKNATRETIASAIRACAAGECVISPELLESLADRVRGVLPAASTPNGNGAEQIRETLTKRELEIFSRLPSGQTNRAIGDAFSLSENTVKNHIASILTKLNLDNRIQAAVHAVRNGFSLLVALFALHAVADEGELIGTLSSLFG
jgi:two-component system nitrate/nitrite response regulator NarL